MSIRRQAVKVLLIFVGIFLIISMSRDLQELLEARGRIEKDRQGVAELEREQQELAKELEYVLSDEFVEKEARDKLMMGKPGEIVVILPEGKWEESTGSSESEAGEEELPNWRKWVRLFL